MARRGGPPRHTRSSTLQNWHSSRAHCDCHTHPPWSRRGKAERRDPRRSLIESLKSALLGTSLLSVSVGVIDDPPKGSEKFLEDARRQRASAVRIQYQRTLELPAVTGGCQVR